MDISHATDLKGVRIAYSPNFGYIDVDPQVAEVVARAVEDLAQLGAHVERDRPRFQRAEAGIQHPLGRRAAIRLTRTMSDAQKQLLDPGLRRIAERGERLSLDDFNTALEARAALVMKMAAFHQHLRCAGVADDADHRVRGRA